MNLPIVKCMLHNKLPFTIHINFSNILSIKIIRKLARDLSLPNFFHIPFHFLSFIYIALLDSRDKRNPQQLTCNSLVRVFPVDYLSVKEGTLGSQLLEERLLHHELLKNVFK